MSGATLLIFTLNVRVPFDHIPLARTSHVALPKLRTGGRGPGGGGVQVDCQVRVTEDSVGDEFLEAQA